MQNVAVLIPTLNPDEKILTLVRELVTLGMENISIVDDGSDSDRKLIFTELQMLGCHISRHEKNRGKGEALKTGIHEIQKNPAILGIVTADGDSQHRPRDIQRVAEKMLQKNEITLGTRRFDGKNIPLKSKIGNTVSSFYFFINTGKKLGDTQTGLRGIPAKYFPFALRVPGSRYEYEMRFLEEMHTHEICYQTIDIETVYEEDRVTHFRPIHDSYRIYRGFFRNIFASLSSAVLDVTLFMIFVSFLGESIITATIFARLLSGIYNFTLNKVWTFEKKDSHNTRRETQRYVILFLIQMGVSGILTDFLDFLIGTSQIGLLFVKIFVDFLLFITNFIVQKHWVFSHKKNIISSPSYENSQA